MNPMSYNNQRYANARFLLGMGPMPPPTNQDLAVAQMQQSLNQGMYGHGANYHMPVGGPYGGNMPHYHGTHLAPSSRGPEPAQYQDHEPAQYQGPELAQSRGPEPAQSQGPAKARRNVGSSPRGNPQLEVRVPGPVVPESASAKATAALPIRLEFSIDDILPADFLSRICANMELSVRDAQLGWKSSDDLKKAKPYPLESEDDVKAAFDHFRPILLSTRRVKKIWMDIINLAITPEKLPAPKVTETAYRDEMHIVKTALACEKHRGPNRWCFVRRDDEGGERCVPLGLEEVSLWARKLHEDKANAPEDRILDDKCLTPPDVLHLDDLEKVAAQREERTKTRKGRNIGPDIHVHIPPMPVFADVRNGTVPERSAKRGRDEILDDSDSSDNDDSPATSITEVLAALHKKMPDLNYPQYEPALREQGIAYASAVNGFDRDFFIDEIHMIKGGVQEFIRVAKRLAKGKGKKRARVDDGGRNKENVA
ncbi:hypothetical protein B0H19DRAFT_1069762 [Mycena capillaripes]|nr:hypothetical protein B0H19DRAFT_1069762 [Mycena capillaripes]